MGATRVQQHRPHRTALNLGLVAGIAGLNLVVLFGVPLWLDRGPLWIVPVALLVVLVNAHWALIHEAMHGLLYPTPAGNVRLGRALAVLFGSPFRLLRYGHLLHHRLARRGIDDDGRYDSARRGALRARLGHYLHLFGGLYALELASCVLVFLPRPVLQRVAAASLERSHRELPGQRRVTAEQLLDPRAIRELRLDGAATLLLLGTSFMLFGEHWPILLGVLVLRGLVISLTDSSFHYLPPESADHQAMNFALPAPLNLLVLNFNYHRVHHRYPGRPWYELPALGRDDADRADCSWAFGLLRQLRGPVAAGTAPAGRRPHADGR